MKNLHGIAVTLVIIGALNWLVLGLFKWDIGQIFGGQMAAVSRVIYVIIGLAGVYEIFGHSKGGNM